MKPLIYPIVAAAFLLCTWAMGSTPAQAAMTLPHLQSYAGSTVTPVHCRRYWHCHRRCRHGRCWRACHRC